MSIGVSRLRAECKSWSASMRLILLRLGISPKQWLYLNCNFESRFKRLVGATEKAKEVCTPQHKRWVHGLHDCEIYLSSST
ncbi:hypothetical protein ACG1BZ_15785 [Microbulbifer sp. CNSA002]|uniref:hypothetical protein n=1 Tax=unclassified Microbulbifer TaxID=2619833 RepID=UPI0039B3B4F9